MAMKDRQIKARRFSMRLMRNIKGTVLKSYVSAVDKLAKEIRKLETIGKGKKYKLTIESKKQLTKALNEEAAMLRKEIKNISLTATKEGVKINAGSYTEYTYSQMKGLNNLDDNILKNVFSKINNDLIEIQALKTYEDGLLFSQRIWNDSKLFRRNIRNIVSEGLARNRDIIDIARDLEVYVRKDKITLAKRYANIDKSPMRKGETYEQWKRRVREFKSRISTNVEYNSLRIVRSQVQGAIQDSNIAASSYTPSVQSFDWNLSPAHILYSICEDIVLGNSWTYETFDYPTPPHPNCLSFTTYNEMKPKKFLSDLNTWQNNPTNPLVNYLNEWKAQYYDPVVIGDNTNYFKLIVDRTNKSNTALQLKRRAA